ncbi:MAG: alpha/beta fold hydrolase [Myxococcota bacterium]
MVTTASDPASSPLPRPLAALFPAAGRHYLDVDGGRMHYIDEGEGEVLLALHGNPTWSFYWRRLIDQFSDRYRVVIPDHIGCGLSDKPQQWPYQLANHRDNVLRLVEALDLHNITLIVHDWGGAIGMAMAARAPERIARLVVTNTAAFRSQSIPWSIASCRIPGFGDLAVRGFNAFARVAVIRAAHQPLAPAVRDGLLFPYDSWHNRIATLRFVEDIPLAPEHPSYDALYKAEQGLETFKDRPMLILWGDGDFCFTVEFRREWEERFPDASVYAWSDVGHYVFEDASDRCLDLIGEFLSENPLKRVVSAP